MRISQRPTYEGKAEGDCLGLPYNTDLVSAAGVCAHFWVQDGRCDLLLKAVKRICGERDVVYVTWSFGKPEGYWAHADIK